MRYRYTDKEMKKILDNMVVIVDSREQNNSHIIDFFNKKNIPYKTIKMTLEITQLCYQLEHLQDSQVIFILIEI